MPSFLIIQSEGLGGRGVRGRTLYRFLSLYHGFRAVRLMSRRDLDRRSPVNCEVLFLGVPTGASPDDLAGIRYRKVVLFDYVDQPGADWQQSDQDFLRSLTDVYLKAWVEPGWDAGIRFGVLPIRRHAVLSMSLRYQKATASLRPARERETDLAFIGYPTSPDGYNQRIQWLLEIRELRERYGFWGGFIASERWKRELEREFGDLTDLYQGQRRVSFHRYFNRMCRAKLVLTPSGNARWSYRHYEAMYAGALPVTCDMRQTETLIPLPMSGMVHVPDHDRLAPHIEAGLAMRRADPDLARDNIAYLERFLHCGDYCRSKPDLMDRFTSQFDG